MSDVWQGPGWWLASDGKWYPADAEPGSVFESDRTDSDAQPDEEVPDQPSAAEQEVRPQTDYATPSPSEVATAVEQNLAAASVEADPAAQAVEPAAFGGDPFAQMPAPVVEQPKIGGWQAIAPEPETAIEPTGLSSPVSGDLEPTVRDEGWTSAFEERQDSGAILDAVVPDIVEPEAVEIPSVEIPVVDAPPAVEIPSVEIPVVDAPPAVEIPSVEIPVVDAPPAVEIPSVEIPVVDAPPAVEIPSVEIPVVDAPPAGDIPDVQPPPATLIDAPTVNRDLGEPIERSDAWRKPLATEPASPRPEASMPTGAADVVDLAIPEEPRPFEPTPERRNWGLVGGIVVGIIAIALLAWLISTLFTGGDDDVQSQDDLTSSTDSSDLSAPSSDDSEVTAAPSTEPDDSNVSVFALRAGDCIVGDIGAGQVTKVTKVDCELEHQFEVYREALIDSSITAFDEEAISAYAEEVCRTSLEAYVPADDERGLKFKFLQPTEDSWNQTEDPDRVITCLLFDEDAPLIGRAA